MEQEKINQYEMKCLSCDKVIKTKNLKRHSEGKLHLKNVKKKVNFMKRNLL